MFVSFLLGYFLHKRHCSSLIRRKTQKVTMQTTVLPIKTGKLEEFPDPKENPFSIAESAETARIAISNTFTRLIKLLNIVI